jgi:hypothetical protein
VRVAATQLDNEIVLHDPTHSNFNQHQFIQDTFPLTGACIVPCSVAVTGQVNTSPPSGSGTQVDAPHR